MDETFDERSQALADWLQNACGFQQYRLDALPADASFRRYFRLKTPRSAYVVMDAPPPNESCEPYIAIANALRKRNLRTPEVFQADTKQGFLLITDFGDATYLKILTGTNVENLYQKALNALLLLQTCEQIEGFNLPKFDSHLMWQEWDWYKQWFLDKFLNLPLSETKTLDACFAYLVSSATEQPQVFMHRDYHSANLMALIDGDVGILDFQDAFIGPITYDLVSLLRDCYIDWPDDQVLNWVKTFCQRLKAKGVLANMDEQQFLVWFELMGVERHLKALFTFSRKYIRDHNANYLKHIPRTLNYLYAVTHKYPKLADLHAYLEEVVQPSFKRVLASCAR